MRVLVTAGPTREAIDDVRYISNASSGRMGFALAAAARDAGHEVVLVAGPVEMAPPHGVEVVSVVSAEEMRDAVLARFPSVDVVFMAAAVADYRPECRVEGKRKKGSGPWEIRLVPTHDILSELGRAKTGQTLVGFALEASDGERNALAKLQAKNLDAIVLNAPASIGADRSDFLVLFRDGRRRPYMSVRKEELARELVSLAGKSRLDASS